MLRVGTEQINQVQVQPIDYDPIGEELFTAERGFGARLNGQPIRVTHATELVDGLAG